MRLFVSFVVSLQKIALINMFRKGKNTFIIISIFGLLATFVAQGIPLVCIFNYKIVASEILDTLVGSFGLIAVAPFTALTSAFFLTKKKKCKKIE